MGMTIAEKIIAAAAGVESVKPGDIHTVESGFGKNREEDAKKAGGTVRRTEADGTSDSWCALLLGTER